MGTRSVWILGLLLSVILGSLVCKYRSDISQSWLEPRFQAKYCDMSTKFHRMFATRSNSSSPSLCVVTRIYGGQIEYFPVFAFALYQSGFDNIRLYLVNTDNRTDMQLLHTKINYINQLVFRKDYIVLLDLGLLLVAGDFGYGMTDRALAHLYEQHTRYSTLCEYIMITNGDNLYARSLGAKILPHMKTKNDIIAWSFVSHHYWGSLQEVVDNTKSMVPKVVDDGTSKCITVKLQTAAIDLGAAVYRFEFLNKYKLLFRESGHSYKFTTDGNFVEKAARLTNASVILKQVLLHHQ